MISKKKKEDAPGPRKPRCSSMGNNRTSLQEGIFWGTREGNRAFGTFGEGVSRKEENILKYIKEYI